MWAPNWLVERAKGNRRAKLLTSTDWIERLRPEWTISSNGPYGLYESVRFFCLNWNTSGTLMVSSSRFSGLIDIWDPFARVRKQTIWLDQAITDAKFTPQSNCWLILNHEDYHNVTILDLETSSLNLLCENCHDRESDTSKPFIQSATHQDEPNLFWTTDFRNTRQFDLRQRHKCRKDSMEHVILYNLTCPSIALNPSRSEMLASTTLDGWVRLYDRRLCRSDGKSMIQTIGFEPGYEWCGNQNLKGISFSKDGSELLVPYDQNLYSFSTYEPWQRIESNGVLLTLSSFNDGARPSHANNYAWLKPYCLWQDLKLSAPQKPTELPQEHQILYNHITRKVGLKTLAKEDYDRINKLLLDHKYCAELYKLRADMLWKRDWEGDRYASLRDLRCYSALKPLRRAKRILKTDDIFTKHKKQILSNTHQNDNPRKLETSRNPSSYYDYTRRFVIDEFNEFNEFDGFSGPKIFGSNDDLVVAMHNQKIFFFDRKTTNLCHTITGQEYIHFAIHPSTCMLAALIPGHRKIVVLSPNERENFDTQIDDSHIWLSLEEI